MPGRTVGHQRVPAFAAPALGDPLALDDEVRNAVVRQVFARREPRLAATDDQRIDFLNRHARAPSLEFLTSQPGG
ncbi:hypothetical protein D3C72_1743200 [compost metagenome]